MQTQTYNSQFTQFNAEEGQVELANATSEAVSNIAAVVVQQKEKQDNLKILNYQTQADIEANKVVNEWRNINAENPNDETANKELDMKLDEIYNKYESNLGIFAKGKWRQVKDLTKKKYKNDNIKWTLAQNMKNADKNLNAVIDSTVSQGYQIGLTGDANPIEVLNQRKEMIRQGAEGLLPADKITESLKTFESDFTRNYLVGLSERSPDQAMKLLENEQIKSSLQVKGGEDMVKEMKRIMNVQKEAQTVKLEQNQYLNSIEYDKAEKDMTLGQKITELESGAKSGKYNEKWATQKVNTLLSSKGINATTKTELYAYYLEQKNDILELYIARAIDEREYLREANKLEIAINKSIENGEINSVDGKEVVISLKKKYGEATAKMQGQGNIFDNTEKKAFKSFRNNLPANASNQAIRDYFKRTDGQTLDKKQKQEIADELMQKYKNSAIDSAINQKTEVAKSKYEIGQIVTMKGKKYQITGFNANGSPKGKAVE